MIRILRRAVLLGLLGFCLAAFTSPRIAWSRGAGAAAEEAGEESPRALLYRVINFVLLVGGLGYVLRKPLTEFFSSRTASIQKSLDDGRKALEASQVQLRSVEEKLQHLGDEIAAFKASAAREMEAERQRLRQVAAEEAARILDSARAQMETALRGARIELKGFAAQQSVALAEELIRATLDEPVRQRLVSQFAATLQAKEQKN